MPQATDILLVFRFLAFATARTCYFLALLSLGYEPIHRIGVDPIRSTFHCNFTYFLGGWSVRFC
jgi:hypothetical protein